MNLLNQTVLQTLREALPADGLDALLQALTVHVIADSKELTRRAQAGDACQVLLLAHRLAGMAANFGCEALADALIRIESELRADPGVVPSPDTLDRVNSLARATATALEVMIRGGRSACATAVPISTSAVLVPPSGSA
jgi:HPt (histidine-containing phosphotransfer) domain-containing protein